MSIIAYIKDLNLEQKESIDTELALKMEEKSFTGSGRVRFIYPYMILYHDNGDDEVTLPFAYACKKLKLSRPPRANFHKSIVKFEGKLRENQREIKKEAIEQLNKAGSTLISLYTGGGKTILAINIATTIQLKTLVLVNKIVLMTQWEESIKRFCPEAVIQKLTPKCKIKDADFYIINAINTEKVEEDFFLNIGLVIVDECHLLMAEKLSRSLQYVHPRYLIGLSATPYRPDGLNSLLDLYFGSDKIVRNLYRPHIVYKVNTGFKPVVEKTALGKLDWNSVLESQANDVERNALIIRIIQHFSDRIFLVLVKRVAQGDYLRQTLLDVGETVTSLLGSQQEFDPKARILIGTLQKVGCGFDHPMLNSLLLAADVEEYYLQTLGRVFRTKDVEPIIFDLVDNHSVLKKHFKTREGVYSKTGGVIRDLCKTCPSLVE